MCPLCIGTTTLLVSGGTSAGGITALVLAPALRRRLRQVANMLRPSRWKISRA